MRTVLEQLKAIYNSPLLDLALKAELRRIIETLEAMV